MLKFLQDMAPLLAMATLSAVVWVAYRHPRSFRYIAGGLVVIYALVAVAFMAYDTGIVHAYKAVSSLPDKAPVYEAMRIVGGLHPNIGVMMLAGSIMTVLLAILFALPSIGLVHKDAYSDEDGEESDEGGQPRQPEASRDSNPPP